MPYASDADKPVAPVSPRDDNPSRPPWLSHLAHDLRNPLSSLHTGVSLLRSGRLGADQQANLLATIQRQLDALTQLVDDTADLLREDAKPLQPIALADVVDIVTSRLSSRLEELGVDIQVSPASGPAAVIGNTKGLIRLIGSLILRVAEIIGTGGRIVAVIEHSDAQLRLRLVSVTATSDMRPEFIALADRLSLSVPAHVTDAALHCILQCHGATVFALVDAEPGVALQFQSAPR
jgi:signal transduction histidine kinase